MDVHYSQLNPSPDAGPRPELKRSRSSIIAKKMQRTASQLGQVGRLEWVLLMSLFQHAAPEEDDGDEMDDGWGGVICCSPVTRRGLPATPATAPTSSPELTASASHCRPAASSGAPKQPKWSNSAPAKAASAEERGAKAKIGMLAWANLAKYKVSIAQTMPFESPPAKPRDLAASLLDAESSESSSLRA